MNTLRWLLAGTFLAGAAAGLRAAEAEFPKPYLPPCTERENVFAFTEKPKVANQGNDRYEITFAVKGNCDVTVAVVEPPVGSNAFPRVVRHVASGVLGANAPAPLQKNALRQMVVWDGKNDLGEYVPDVRNLSVRVQLGLKPVYERLLGGADPHTLPGVVIGVAVTEEGGFVVSRGSGGHAHAVLRRFDRDGNYVRTLTPPPSDLPWDRLQGCGYIEYEPGKRALHGPKVLETMAGDGFWLPGLNGNTVSDLQPAIYSGKIFYPNGGAGYFQGSRTPSLLYYLYTDGGTDVAGVKGLPFFPQGHGHINPRLAFSPDGKWLYMVNPDFHALARYDLASAKLELFLGKAVGGRGRHGSEPGSDNEHLNNPLGVDCDAQGRIYIADGRNNRVQVYSPEIKHLKTIPLDRPTTVRVHQKTGAIYVFHYTTIQGRSVPRLSKLASADDPKDVWHVDGMSHGLMAVDSWSAKPRLWIGGEARESYGSSFEGIFHQRGPSVTIWEDDGASLKKFLDFEEVARTKDGPDRLEGWSADVFSHVNCDPVREEIYWNGFRADPTVFDLRSGKKLRTIHMPGSMNDLAFDKRGYMHIHLDPGFYVPGVIRVNPAAQRPYADHLGRRPPNEFVYPEVPYNYGVDLPAQGFVGAIPVKDQPGAKFFQDGFGVNMRGDLAVQSNIYYMPRMEEESFSAAFAGVKARLAAGGRGRGDTDPYQEYLRNIKEKERRGEEVYSIPRRPGLASAGATAWIYAANGELRYDNAMVCGGTMAGVQIDEDGQLYAVVCRQRMFKGKPFLAGQKKYLGTNESTQENDRNPFSACYVKARPKSALLLKGAMVPLDVPPERATDMVSGGPFGDAELGHGEGWADGIEWIYAGAGPIIASGCTCASMRSHLDWYKRSFVPEAYRHSLAVLDTAGNLVMHVGSYGNHDDAMRMKPGTEDVRLFHPRFVSGTDNYLAFEDWGERLVVLRLACHAEEMAPVGKP
jgi:hypothetical protein